MEQMIRKQIYIERRQEALLKRAAKQRGMTEAEIIRHALERELATRTARRAHRDPAAWDDALAFMYALRKQGPLPNRRRTWKREDAYEERLSRYEHRSR